MPCQEHEVPQADALSTTHHPVLIAISLLIFAILAEILYAGSPRRACARHAVAPHAARHHARKFVAANRPASTCHNALSRGPSVPRLTPPGDAGVDVRLPARPFSSPYIHGDIAAAAVGAIRVHLRAHQYSRGACCGHHQTTKRCTRTMSVRVPRRRSAVAAARRKAAPGQRYRRGPPAALATARPHMSARLANRGQRPRLQNTRMR